VVQHIPDDITWIIESVVAPADIGPEIEFVRNSFKIREPLLISD
jgi:hypothetical protein